MTGCNKINVIFSVSILYMAVAQFAYGSPVISDNLAVSCIQSVTTGKLHCDYRLKNAAPVQAITAGADNKTLAINNIESYPWNDAITAILLLVDTSDPGRQNVIEQNKKDIARILSSVRPYHRIGLARFDKSLHLEAPIGASNDQITTAAEQLRAVGQTTELYRSVLSAVEMLEKVNADRKSIFIFSDGLFEDTAYFHQDVVQAAKQAGVIITSLGYPRSVALSVGLQTLRRLSEETGGVFVETDMTFRLSETFLGNPVGSLDNGGRFNIDLSQLPASQNRQSYSIRLDFETGTGNYPAEIQVSLPAAAVPKTAESDQSAATSSTQPSAQQPIVITREDPPATKLNLWLWYGIPAVLIVLLIITLVAFFLIMSNQGRKKQTTTGGFNEFRPYAYLVVQDETKKRYPITNTIWRIGRGTDNEMTLRDSSVSRRHAEIDRDKGDVFTIIDLDSTNGVYVNNKKIDKQVLREGDIIEIGDINLRFTLLPAEYTFEEVTEIQNTRAPFTH